MLRAGPAVLGDVICFEVAYDEVVRDTVTGGAQLLVVQTNNATFDVAEARQQLAMVRLRAVEHGRAALMASTVGVSGFVTPDGRVSDATGFNTRRGRGPASCASATGAPWPPGSGVWPEVALAGLARRGPGRRGGAAPPPGARTAPDRTTAGTHGGSGGTVVEATDDRRADGLPRRGAGARGDPHLQRGRQRRRRSSTGSARAAPAVDILVADDNSPDGTGAIADALAAADPRVHVLHREGKQGLGAAYLAGFAWARERGYDAVVEMDADGSHAPEDLPALLDAARDADVVIGSRWTRGARVVNWPLRRLLLSRGGNLYARLALGMPVSDATGGYRVYRLSVAGRRSTWTSVCSQGYSFQVELSRLAHRAGVRIVEVPITFAERERGRQQDEPADRGRGAVADHRVGAAGPAAGGAAGPARHPDRSGAVAVSAAVSCWMGGTLGHVRRGREPMR